MGERLPVSGDLKVIYSQSQRMENSGQLHFSAYFGNCGFTMIVKSEILYASAQRSRKSVAGGEVGQDPKNIRGGGW